MITEAPAETSTHHQQRARAIGVMREVEFAIPDDMRADVGVSAHYVVRVQIMTDDPNDARSVAIALGFTRPVELRETDAYVHHTYSGAIDGYPVEIKVLAPKVTTS